MMELIKNLSFRNKAKLPIILQDQITECGHACIVMISCFFGHSLDLHGLRKINQPSAQGITMRQISELLQQLNLKPRALKISLKELKYIKTPAILHWNTNHFVVLKKISNKKIIIHDPAFGVKSCKYDELNKCFTGFILEIEKDSDFKKITSRTDTTLYKIIKTIPGINRIFIYLMFLSLSIEILTLINPLFLQYTTDKTLIANNIRNLYPIAATFILIVIIHTAVEYIRERLILYATTNFTKNFSSNVFKHLLNLPISFFTARYQGDIQSKFQTIEQIKTKVSNDFINTFLDGIMFIITIFVMLIYSKILTSIVLLSLALYISLRYVSYQSFKNESSSAMHLHSKVTNIFLETMRAISPIKLFFKEKIRFNTWKAAYMNALNADINCAKTQIIYKISSYFLYNLEYIMVICIGTKFVIEKKISIGMLLAFLSYRLMLINKASSLIQNIFDYKLLSVQLNRLGDILSQEEETTIKPKLELQRLTTDYPTVKRINFKNIYFQYNQNEPYVINNLSLEINVGEKIAIIGPSGCGKSTLLKIIMGLLQPSSGQIIINGIPINTYNLQSYRSNIAAVMQEDFLFTGSILENITFFEEKVDFELVYKVTKISQIHEIIVSLPMGYKTLIGDMGSILSGGQKQRLLLARALYKKPTILFLDEATSHLDYTNEKLINQALKSMQITQIIVAHREETIKMADKIIRLLA